jgi:His-Xaa-Ser system protein HxsD
MAYRNFIEDKTIHAFADSKIHSKESILKCLYWYSDKFHVYTELTQDGFFEIILKPLYSESTDLSQYLLKLERDIIDYNLRDIITKETVNIRELLIAKAFSHGEFDENPPGEISDPVGFNPQSLKND